MSALERVLNVQRTEFQNTYRAMHAAVRDWHPADAACEVDVETRTPATDAAAFELRDNTKSMPFTVRYVVRFEGRSNNVLFARYVFTQWSVDKVR